MSKRFLCRIACLCFCIALTSAASAGQGCSDKPFQADSVRKGLELALKTRARLEQSGAQVALIGRVGADLSEHGLRYSHMGFVWRDHPAGRWYVIHELNTCGTGNSGIFDEGLGNFFLDDPFAYEALILIPSSEVQEKLVKALSGNAPGQMHSSDYSMIANPFSTRYQNSNQWLLEVMASALTAVVIREQAQTWLKQNGYVPSTLRISQSKRLGAKLFAANVKFDDHTSEEWLAARYNVVTVDSVKVFLAKLDKGTTSLVLKQD